MLLRGLHVCSGSFSDLDARSRDVRLAFDNKHQWSPDQCPFRAMTGSRCLLDHVVGAGEESRRDFEAKRLGSLEVDPKI